MNTYWAVSATPGRINGIDGFEGHRVNTRILQQLSALHALAFRRGLGGVEHGARGEQDLKRFSLLTIGPLRTWHAGAPPRQLTQIRQADTLSIILTKG